MTDAWWLVEHPGWPLQLASALLAMGMAGALLIRQGSRDEALVAAFKLLLLGVLSWLVVVPVAGMLMQAIRDGYWYEFRNTKDVLEIVMFVLFVLVGNGVLFLWLYGNSLLDY